MISKNYLLMNWNFNIGRLLEDTHATFLCTYSIFLASSSSLFCSFLNFVWKSIFFHLAEPISFRASTSSVFFSNKFATKLAFSSCNCSISTGPLEKNGKVHIFWEGHKILRNLHQLFVLCTASQIIGGDFAKFCGLLRIYEL